METTCISPSVIVPVLSEQITDTLPSVSAAIMFRVNDPRFNIRCIPIANITVTETSNPSGIAATARAADISNISNTDLPTIIPAPNNTTIKTVMIMAIHLANRANST